MSLVLVVLAQSQWKMSAFFLRHRLKNKTNKPPTPACIFTCPHSTTNQQQQSFSVNPRCDVSNNTFLELTKYILLLPSWKMIISLRKYIHVVDLHLWCECADFKLMYASVNSNCGCGWGAFEPYFLILCHVLKHRALENNSEYIYSCMLVILFFCHRVYTLNTLLLSICQ